MNDRERNTDDTERLPKEAELPKETKFPKETRYPKEERLPSEEFTVHLTDPMLYDRLHTLSMEYSVSVDALAGIAVKRLMDDVDFVRGLRMGRYRG